MKVTEVRIFPTESKDGKLKAFATMTFDDWFVVRNVKIIQGTSGLFVAMPSRKAMGSCPRCRTKNVVGSKYCNQCGSQLDHEVASDERDQEQQGNHMDIAHPITKECRVYIQEQILAEYDRQIKQPQGKGRFDYRKNSNLSAIAESEGSGGISKKETPSTETTKSSEIESGMDIEL